MLISCFFFVSLLFALGSPSKWILVLDDTRQCMLPQLSFMADGELICLFCHGNLHNPQELKQGYLAKAQALVAAKNLNIKISGGNESKMASYKPGAALALVSLGRKEAVAQFPLITISGIIPGMIKSKDLFVGKGRKELGLTP